MGVNVLRDDQNIQQSIQKGRCGVGSGVRESSGAVAIRTYMRACIHTYKEVHAFAERVYTLRYMY